MSDREKDLQAEELADLARRLEAALDVEAPEARHEKALFVAGIGARRRSRRWLGSLAPALAAVVLLVAIGIASRDAQPGQALFGVREALDKVGLAPSTTNEIREYLTRAENLVVEAESLSSSAPTSVEGLVSRAERELDRANDLVGELDSDRRAPYENEIEALEERADAAENRADDTLDAREDAEDQDSSGSGSGGGDSSGPGSGGDDDSSGSGSGGGGDDDDDSSGSGSGGDDDSSGSGSGGGDDSSGSGSGSDGAGDSSGKG